MAGIKLYTIGVIFALSLCYFALLASGQVTDPQEVQALLAIRSKLKDPKKNLNNWKKKDPCVEKWKGLICTNQTDPLDGYYHVLELRLLNKNLFGTLSPELGQLSNVTILDFMWNNIGGSIPKEIGNLGSLQLLLLSGNQISGPLPDELGSLPNLTRFQLDLNCISGPIPKSFANLPSVKHFHMNNNSISGQIPPELSKLHQLQHILLDNNNLSGYLPPELYQMPKLTILQLDNNDFSGTVIPDSYGSMSKLLKLSLRNCNLQGTIPDLSGVSRLLYLDLSMNKLTGSIPTNKLSANITTINLSNNSLNGSIPLTFSGLPQLQNLSLANNLLSGSVPTAIWQNITFTPTAKLLLDFENNLLSDISGILNPPPNVTIKLQGNPVCAIGTQQNIVQFCGPTENGNNESPPITNNSDVTCLPQSCPTSDYEYIPSPPIKCFCAAPFVVVLSLRSPSISHFPPYSEQFISYMTTSLSMDPYQLHIDSIMWQMGRLLMYLKFFPSYSNTSKKFNDTELQQIMNMFATFLIPENDTFGPYDLINFTFVGPYSNVSKPGMSKGAKVRIVLGTISCAITAVLAFTLVFLKWNHRRRQRKVSKDQSPPKLPLKMEGVQKFSFEELEIATKSFSSSAQIGEGGYGKVYKSILANGSVVAIKRAHQGSLQGEKEFYTEIELLSRVHHRNLVSLIGYCDEESEQMLVYEFMPNGSLHDLLSGRYRGTLNFATRLNIALGASKGILYLHSEADPPIFHRDIKANNILLDSKFTAKVSDFGISRLAPVPDDQGVAAAHISTGVKGTYGYVDPEYFLTHKCTDKSDVYSLGIVFLELLTGMQPISHGRNIVREVNAACQSGMMFSIIDRRMGLYPSECIKKFMALALRCSQDEMKDRPSMSEVVRELEDIYSMLPEPDRIVSLELEESTFETSGSAPSSVHSRRKSYVSVDASGSDLVSGVIPTIRPR